jgi:hypothetical protein
MAAGSSLDGRAEVATAVLCFAGDSEQHELRRDRVERAPRRVAASWSKFAQRNAGTSDDCARVGLSELASEYS